MTLPSPGLDPIGLLNTYLDRLAVVNTFFKKLPVAKSFQEVTTDLLLPKGVTAASARNFIPRHVGTRMTRIIG